MRIAIDLACWTNPRGYGRYTRNLVTALLAADHQHSYVGFADAAGSRDSALADVIDMVWVPLDQAPIEAASAEGMRRVSDVWRMSRAVRDAHLDLMFFPSSYTYFPVLGVPRRVVVIHDAIPERLPRLVFPHLRGRLAWMLKTRLACWQAQRVVTVSVASAQAIQRHLPVRGDRLRVIHEAADPVFRVRDTAADRELRVLTLQRHGIPTLTPVVLYVGGFGPHKNVRTLIDAFAALPADPAAHLVLAGKIAGEAFYSEITQLRARVREHGLEGRVTFTDLVPDEDLVHLYNAARCVVLPSHDEGFGLPVVEAMACGTPVIASRVGALPELVGARAGVLFQPNHPGELTEALRRLLFGEPALWSRLREAGLRRAADLSWDQAARQLLAVFAELDHA